MKHMIVKFLIGLGINIASGALTYFLAEKFQLVGLIIAAVIHAFYIKIIWDAILVAIVSFREKGRLTHKVSGLLTLYMYVLCPILNVVLTFIVNR